MINNLNQAVISLGGKGTRLNSITNKVPKPLWPILGFHTLERTLKNLTEEGIDKFIFLINYKAEFFKKEKILLEKKYNIQIQIYEEEKPRGEAGALIEILNYLDRYCLEVYNQLKENTDHIN